MGFNSAFKGLMLVHNLGISEIGVSKSRAEWPSIRGELWRSFNITVK